MLRVGLLLIVSGLLVIVLTVLILILGIVVRIFLMGWGRLGLAAQHFYEAV